MAIRVGCSDKRRSCVDKGGTGRDWLSEESGSGTRADLSAANGDEV